MNEWLNEWIDGWMNERMDGRLDKWKISKSLNTVDSKSLNKEYEYIIHTKNTILSKENIEIHIYGENYNWDYIPLNKENKETEELELPNYFPEEICIGLDWRYPLGFLRPGQGQNNSLCEQIVQVLLSDVVTQS